MFDLQRVPNRFKTEISEVPVIRGGEMSHSVMTEREGETRVDDLSEPGRGRRCPLPQWSSDCGIVVARFPIGIETQGFTERRRVCGRLRACEHRRISKLHVNLDQHQTAQQESFAADSLFVEEPPSRSVVRRLRSRETGSYRPKESCVTALCDSVDFHTGQSRVDEKIAATIERRKLPATPSRCGWRESLHEMLRSFSHDF